MGRNACCVLEGGVLSTISKGGASRWCCCRGTSFNGPPTATMELVLRMARHGEVHIYVGEISSKHGIWLGSRALCEVNDLPDCVLLKVPHHPVICRPLSVVPACIYVQALTHITSRLSMPSKNTPAMFSISLFERTLVATSK